MQHKYEFKTDEEKQIIIERNKDLYLVEVQNITAGNFLIFSDVPNRAVEQVIEMQRDQIDMIEANFMYDSMMKDMAIEATNSQQANMMYQLMIKGVL